MDLPNQYFQDFPIDFKEINPQDFPNFQVEGKIIISPNKRGYINTALQENINRNEKNTLVINAAVGQGKTYSIIQLIKDYYEDEQDYLIFVAAPYTSLVQQYCEKIKGVGIPETQIYSYDYIGNEMHLDAWNSKIQVLTVNALLGNPGENDFINSQLKRDYINYLVSKCDENDRKVVFIYDEIHDSYYNFKEEYIFNLWKWRNVIQKNILLSATYNEASKIVIEYLAELTDDKIKIIESERVRLPERQSDLYLHFNPSNYYSHTNDGLVKLVENLINRGKNIDILSFGKTLADNICNITGEGVGKVLFDAGIEVQNCTSDMDDNQRPYREIPQNRYRPDKCNIGTNFKSGVSIEKEKHAFIVILPPLGRKGKFKNKFGIFTDGVNSVIQALARQRNSTDREKGEIHIVLPPPDKFDTNTLPFKNELREEFSNFYKVCQNFRSSDSDMVKYHSVNSQDKILLEYYQDILHSEIANEESYVGSLERQNKIRLEYPSYKLFKLNNSEKYFSGKIKFFGKDLSAYVTYAAITNQFVNCNLVGVNVKPPLFFIEEKIQSKLEIFYQHYLDLDFYNSLYVNVTDRYKYYELKNELFKYKVLYKEVGSVDYREITSFSSKNFEQQFLAFVQRKFYPNNREFTVRFNRRGKYVDSEFTRGEYFSNYIAHSKNIIESDEAPVIANAYIKLELFRQKLINSIQTRRIKGSDVNYITKTPLEGFFSEEEKTTFSAMCRTLLEHDDFIIQEVFEFKRYMSSDESLDLKLSRFYTYLKQDFFLIKTRKIGGIDYDEILGVRKIPESSQVLNFILNGEATIPEERIPEVVIVDGQTFLKNSQGEISSFGNTTI